MYANILAGCLAISINTGITMILEENGAEWIHTVWVVIASVLLIDYSREFDGTKILRTVKKIVALIDISNLNLSIKLAGSISVTFTV